MSIEFTIDPAAGVVVTIVAGAVSGADFLAYQKRLRAHPAFRPDMRQLLDLTGVTVAHVSAADMRLIAHGTVFLPTARRAFVVGSDAAFGLSRMYQLTSDRDDEHLQVFRDLGEARRWLWKEEPALALAIAS